MLTGTSGGFPCLACRVGGVQRVLGLGQRSQDKSHAGHIRNSTAQKALVLAAKQT